MIRKILMGLAAVVGFTTAATAAIPVGVWDGFNSMTSGDYTWTASAGTTVEEGVVTIGSDGGLTMANPTGLGDKAVTFIADIEGFDPDGTQMTIFDVGLGDNRVNISSRPSDNNVYQLWNANNGYGNVGTISTGKVRIITTYSAGSGTTTYVVGGNTADSGSLKSSGSSIDSLGIGCYSGTQRVAEGMKIYRLAMFNRKLSEDESKAYLFPSEKPKHDYESVLSLNFGASAYDVPADTDPGACVDDSNWYNFSGAGTGTAGDVTVTRTTSGNYQNTGKAAQYLKGYLDDYSDNKTAVTVSISDLETAPYDVYIYCSSDNASGWSCKTVNGVAYTADATGKGVSGTSTWGNNNNLSEVLGKNVMVVENVYPDAESKITIASVRNSGYRGCVAAIQVCRKPAAPTYEAEIDEDTDWKDIVWDPSKPEGGFEDDAVLKLKVNSKHILTFSEILNIPQRLEINDDSENALTLKAADALFTDGCYEKTIATFGSFVPGCAKATAALPTGFSGAYALTSNGFKVRAQNREVISINIGGGSLNYNTGPIDSPEANLVPADQNYYGVAPTMGETWNNIGKQWKNTRSTVTLEGSKAAQADGTVVERPTIDLSATATTTWQAGITNPFLRGYLDDGDGLEVAVHGVPYTKYDVIVYATSDATSAVLSPITVNGAQYTFVDGETVKGSTIWGKALCNVPAIGDNALYIKDCTGEQLTISAAKTTGGRGTLCAVQVINQGEILIRSEYYGEMDGDVVWTDGKTAGNLKQIGDDWVNGQLSTITITNTVEGANFSFGAETIGQQIKFVSEYPITIDAASMVQYGKLGIYDFSEVKGGAIFQLPEDEAFDAANLPTTIKGDWKFSKDGILVFNGKLPTAAEKAFFTNEVDWAGTVWIKNYAVSGQVFNEYGNANSKLRFTGVKGWFNYNTNETTLPIELVDEGETRALEVTDGSLNKSYIFDKVTGDGSINVSSVHDDAFIVQFKDVSEHTGKITSLASTTPDGDATKPFPILIGVMEGALPYGTNSCITVADGATINAGCGWQAKSAAFGATLNVKTGEEDDAIVSGLEMQAPVYLGTKVLLPDSQYFSCLGYENGTIKIVSPNEFAIIPGENATIASVLGAVAYEEYYYAAEGASVRITYKAKEGYIFPNGTDTLVDEITVEGGEEYKPSQTPGKYVAKIDETCYESLNDAFAAVDDNGKTIFMLQDTAITNGIDLAWDYAWSTTLDMNGKTITPGYNPDKDAFVPMFNVSTGVTFTIKGNGTITGWEGALGKEYDSKGVIVVDGGWLMFKNGTLTAGGQDDKGMYGVAVFGNGTAYFGDQGVVGGPTITTWFAPIGASNQNPGDEGVEIIVYDGAYTQLATPAEEGAWWSPFCAAIHAQADGTYDIKGGAFTGALYSVSTPYANVDQDINFYGGTFEKPLFVGDETGAHPCETPDRVIWKDDAVTLNVEPEGYVWDGRGYLTRKVCVLISAGTEFFYDSVEKAFELATDGDTVKLLQNATITNGIDLVYDGGYYWYVTFDLNGKTLSPAYTPTKETYKPMFNVSSNAYLTIIDSSAKKGGTIAGWKGETAAALDTKAVINVDGGFLYFESGALTAGGVDDCGLYGVYVSGSASAWFGETNKTENAEGTGPKIDTWFAAIGCNNTTPGTLGVAIKVYGGEYTQLAEGKDTTWAKYCSAIYAPADGTYDIYGGTFNGTVGSIAMPYKDVDQNVNIYAGTFVKTLYVAETETGKSGARYRNIWKDLENKSLILAAPQGYCWDTFGYLQLAIARIKETDMYFPSLQAAFNSVGNGQTVEMLGDIVLTNGIDFVYDEGYAWETTLDMQGHKLTAQYDREKATHKPVFNVSSNAFVTITGNGTIEAWTGAAATNYDGKAVIDVDGGFLYYLNGTLTAGGEGEWGMYGVNVCGSGKAEFGADGVTGGPTITTWFAPIGANNLNPGTLGVDITVYDGTYTQLADGTGKWWSYFCAAIYAPADGKYDIKGGTFKGALYCLSTRYANVDQDIWFYGGDFQSPLFVDEVQGTHQPKTPGRNIWKDLDEVALDAPTGYEWDADGNLVKKGEPEPVPPGGEIVVPEGQAGALAESINKDPTVKAQYLKAPGDVETTDTYRSYFNAVATSGTTVQFFLNETGTNAVVEATEEAKTDALAVALSIESSTLTIDEPLVGFYYSFKQGDDVKNLGFNVESDQNKLAGKDTITFTLVKKEGASFYQTIITPTPTKPAVEMGGAQKKSDQTGVIAVGY